MDKIMIDNEFAKLDARQEKIILTQKIENLAEKLFMQVLAQKEKEIEKDLISTGAIAKVCFEVAREFYRVIRS
jgi:metal-dependent hydrolase (beta-lactamase superfamily II)